MAGLNPFQPSIEFDQAAYFAFLLKNFQYDIGRQRKVAKPSLSSVDDAPSHGRITAMTTSPRGFEG
jgi:hypothetical protein